MSYKFRAEDDDADVDGEEPEEEEDESDDLGGGELEEADEDY